MAEQQYRGTQYRNNMTHTNILTLFGTNEEKTASVFSLYLTGNTVRIRVYTGLSEDKQRKQQNITLSFDSSQIPSFFMMLDTLKQLAEDVDGEEKKIKFGIKTFVKSRDGGKSEKHETGAIIAGRSKSGVVWISAQDNYHGKVVFPLKPNRDITCYNTNTQEPADAAYVSQQFTKSWVDLTKRILANVAVQEYVEKEDASRNNNRGGNSGDNGGYNNQSNNNYPSGNNNSNNNSSSHDNFGDSFDDLLP